MCGSIARGWGRRNWVVSASMLGNAGTRTSVDGCANSDSRLGSVAVARAQDKTGQRDRRISGRNCGGRVADRSWPTSQQSHGSGCGFSFVFLCVGNSGDSAELGHLLTGWAVGFRFSSIQVGPVSLRIEHGILKARFRLEMAAMEILTRKAQGIAVLSERI
jgi:hypothetical protein